MRGAAVAQRGTGPYVYLTGSPASLSAVAVPPEAIRPRPNAFRLLANSTRPAFSDTLSKAERRKGHDMRDEAFRSSATHKPTLSSQRPRGRHVARPPFPNPPRVTELLPGGHSARCEREREEGKERSRAARGDLGSSSSTTWDLRPTPGREGGEEEASSG